MEKESTQTLTTSNPANDIPTSSTEGMPQQFATPTVLGTIPSTQTFVDKSSATRATVVTDTETGYVTKITYNSLTNNKSVVDRLKTDPQFAKIIGQV